MKNYCNEHKNKEFEDVPPPYSGDIEAKWEQCIDCGYMRTKRRIEK